LSTLIHIDTNKADEFVSKLSGIYRYVLNHQDADMVAVEKELAFAEDFADLQAIRFNQNFTLTIQKFEGSENTMIIPLSLQLLLENVFKHNIISQNKKVHISISFEDKYLVVSNNKTMTKEVKTSHAVGLSNIMNRYAVVSDQQCVVEDTNDYFTVKIPLVHVD
ncbi:MAG: histidine kinase, partial [Bacteroidetes bacterium CG_4_10_14_3_um_filter_42_6]